MMVNIVLVIERSEVAEGVMVNVVLVIGRQ